VSGLPIGAPCPAGGRLHGSVYAPYCRRRSLTRGDPALPPSPGASAHARPRHLPSPRRRSFAAAELEAPFPRGHLRPRADRVVVAVRQHPRRQLSAGPPSRRRRRPVPRAGAICDRSVAQARPLPGGTKGAPERRRAGDGALVARPVPGSAPNRTALQKRRQKASPSKRRKAGPRGAHQGVAPGHPPLRPLARSGPRPAGGPPPAAHKKRAANKARTAVAPATAHW